MNILLKNKDALIKLFATFSEQELLQVKQNLISSWHFLKLPPTKLLNAMNAKQVDIELFLGKKCLPLVRFYLLDQQAQRNTFLSSDLLSQLFISLPAVEAVIFKRFIVEAEKVSESLINEVNALARMNKANLVIEFTGFQGKNKKVHTRESLSKLAEIEKQHLNCFFYFREGQLSVVPEGDAIDVDTLLYSELSPLQQLKAQKLFANNDDTQSVNAQTSA